MAFESLWSARERRYREDVSAIPYALHETAASTENSGWFVSVVV